MATQAETQGYTSLFAESPWKDSPPTEKVAVIQPDLRNGAVYEYTKDLQLAVEVALVTGRPLLLRGDPGTGKSSLAAFVARNLKWRYYEHVITARTTAQDLQYSYDTVQRLADAQARIGNNQLSSGKQGSKDTSLNNADYVVPGVLWWAFDRAQAKRRGIKTGKKLHRTPVEPLNDINKGRDPKRAVVLIDEIDKADPDVPNNLLVALGSRTFTIPETETVVKGQNTSSPQQTKTETQEDKLGNLLVVITTNQERDLPQAFLRRCIVYTLKLPEEEQQFITRMSKIAEMHCKYESITVTDREKYRQQVIAEKLWTWRQEMKKNNRRPPGTAEYLDAVRAARELELDITRDLEIWDTIERITFFKE